MEGKLKGRSAVVTGGGRGIGREVSLALAAEAASVLIVDPGVSIRGESSDKTAADEVVSDIKARGGTALADYRSVADFRAAEEIINRCVENFGRIDILVNCAGILRERMVWNLTEDDWDAVLSVHLKGTFNCSRRAAALMREQRYGRILNLVSHAWLGEVGQSNYCAAKGGIVSFTKALARELGKYRITANAVAPWAGTRLNQREEVRVGVEKALQAGLITKEYYETVVNLGGPRYIAPLCTYLASDKAANINGQVFFVMKGKVAIYSEPVQAKAIYKYEMDGMWTADELEKQIPDSLLVDYTNPAPPEAR